MPQVFARTIYGLDTPQEGVAVKLHNSLGTEVGSGFTGADGLVFLGDHAAGMYELRLGARAARSPANRLAAEVPAAGGPYVFLFPVADPSLPVSDDPALCLCTGYFVSPDGSPAAGKVVELTLTRATGISEGETRVLSGSPSRAVVGSTVSLETGKSDGKLSVPLIRRAAYWVSADARLYPMVVYIPDAPSADLVKILHPRVAGLVWKKAGVELDRAAPAEFLTVGESVEFEVAILLDSGAFADFGWASLALSDDTVVELSRAFQKRTVFSKVTVTGLEVGVATVSLLPLPDPEDGYGFGLLDDLLGTLSLTVNAP